MAARKKAKKETPLIVSCPECSGDGKVQAVCDWCSKLLTEENVLPGADDICAKCAAEEDIKNP
jgi:hypothetical protein